MPMAAMMISLLTAELGGAKKRDEEGVEMPRHLLAPPLVKAKDGEQRRDGEQEPLPVALDDFVPVHVALSGFQFRDSLPGLLHCRQMGSGRIRPGKLSPIFRAIMREAGRVGDKFF